VLTSVRQRFQLLIGRGHVLVAIALLFRGIRDRLREESGTVEIDVQVQEVRTERVDLFGELLRDLGIAQMLAYHGAVLGLCQDGIVVPMAGRIHSMRSVAQQCGDLIIDVLRAVIGVDAQDPERKPFQPLPDDREHVRLTDLLASRDEMELRLSVHGIDVVHPPSPCLGRPDACC
jgi:hypothetical protein